jgi:hypothetical protein
MRTRELALREGFVHVPEEVKFWTLMPVDVGAVDAHALPVLVRTLPAVLGATAVTALVPLPMRTALAVKVAAPVPPCATVTAVPDWRTVPVTLGNVSVVSAAAAPASRVTEPPPEFAFMITGIAKSSSSRR